MPGPIDDIRRQLRIELMQADIETKRADTVHKHRFTDWEPWKAIALVAGAAAAVFSVIGALSVGYCEARGDTELVAGNQQAVR